MLKQIIFFIALVAFANCQLGGQQTVPVTSEVIDAVKWATSQLSQFTLSSGEHTVLNIRDVTVQIVAGSIYRFTVDVSVEGVSYSCRVAVAVQPWTGMKFLVPSELPKCTQN
ncbi:unnamed protein product [Brachionus calyciflorus]|uniref:Cystatin domain-containing protein n=1 Tax=Brachionus calyciflorus TaxID=104777 RepID=A0A813PPJ4_9BILA|nr:unnamed protein product [Brachionus calyciflorus]